MKMRSNIKTAMTIALAGAGLMLISGCNTVGSGAGLNADGTVISTVTPAGCPDVAAAPAASDTSSTPVSFANDVLPIFTTGSRCTACHSAPSGIGYAGTGGATHNGLDLTSANAYASLVGKVTFELPAKDPNFRVAPGSPDCSYLLQKLSSSPKSGSQMPLGGTPLSADEIAIIKNWIQHGAPND